MAREPKFAVLEIDGVELGGPSEYIPESCDIRYVANNSLTVKDKLDTLASELAINNDSILVGYDNGDVLTSGDGYVLTEEL